MLGKPSLVVQVNYDIDPALHRRMKLAATYRGQTLKAWLELAILDAVERQEAERAEAERRRRSR